MSNRMKLLAIFSLIFLLLIATADLTSAQTVFQKGKYWGLSLPYNYIEGDFDGDYFDFDPEIIIFPKVEPNFGIGGTLGYRFTRNFSCEGVIVLSQHEGYYEPLGSFNLYNMILGISAKFELPLTDDERLKVYGTAGIAEITALVEDGAYSIEGFYEKSSDIIYAGFCATSGLGMSFDLNRNLALKGEILYRLGGYYYSKSKWEEGSNSVDGTGYTFQLGVVYYNR